MRDLDVWFYADRGDWRFAVALLLSVDALRAAIEARLGVPQ